MTGADITLKAAVLEDADGILPLIDLLGDGDPDERREILAGLLDNPLYNAYVAREPSEGDLVGFIDLWELPDLTHGASLGYVSALVVKRGWEGKGIGSMLLEHVLEAAREKGLAEMHVSTEKGNHRARKLYGRMGFTAESLLMEIDTRGKE